MGSDLQLTGLASGFDWKPVVEQLIELEAIPKQRLQSEKSANEEKISDLGILKSQLDTLNGASKTLQGEDLYQARKVGMDSISASIISASAASGALTGDYVVSVYSIGTQTEMSSKNRVPGGLGAGLNTAVKLSELPLQTAITKGTFSIAGKTLSIDSLDVTLQSIIDEINTAVGSVAGVNPESDSTGITFEYDSASDKMIVDGGELSINALNSVPILGSPTDSSNFLKSLRLLNRTTVLQDADYDATNVAISLWGSGNATTNPEKKSWLYQTDTDEGGGVGLASTDSRIYAAYDYDSDGEPNIFRRKDAGNQFNPATAYASGVSVYKNGFIYTSQMATPTTAWANTQGDASGTTEVTFNSKNWKLMKDLETKRVGNDGTGTTRTSFSIALNAGDHPPVTGSGTAATTGDANYIKQGDIVKGSTDSYFRAIRDRTENAENFGTLGGGLWNLQNGNSSGAWNQNVGGTGKFRPDKIYVDGHLYEANTGGGATFFGSNNGFVQHGGNTGQVNFSQNDLVVGSDADAAVKDKAYRAAAAWDTISSLPATNAAQTTKWANTNYVQADDNKFYQATANWSNVTTHNGTTNYDPASAATKFVHTTADTTNYYEAMAKWSAVTDFADVQSIDANYDGTDHFVFHTGQNQFYSSKLDIGSISGIATKTSYNTTGTMAQKFATEGSGAAKKYYKAKGDGSSTKWDAVNAFAEGGNDLSGITANSYIKLSSDGAGNGRFFKSRVDLDAINSNSWANTSNHSANSVVKDGTQFWKAKLVTADAATPTFNNTVTSAQIRPMTNGQRVVDATNGVVYEATSALQAVNDNNHSAGTNYSTNDIVATADNRFWEAQSNITASTTYNSANGGGYATGSFVEDSSVKYKLNATYNGEFVGGVSATSTAIGQFVKVNGGNYYRSLVNNANSDPATTPLDWQDTGQSTLSGLSGLAGADQMVEDATKAFAPTLGGNSYWTEVTTIKTPSTDSGNTYWNVISAATNLGENAYWTEVTSDITLSAEPTATNTYWADVTDALADLATDSEDFWDDVTNDVTLNSALADGGSNDYWDEVTTTLTTLGSNPTWWADARATIQNGGANTGLVDKANTIYWTEVTSTVNDLTANTTWWTDVTDSLTDRSNAGFGNWWTEIAHANGTGDFDSNYFQEIKPEMAVLTGTGASGGINANVQDHTMWAEMANLAAFAGADGNFGTHDATEDPYKATTVNAWNNGTTYTANDIVSGSDNNYYRFKTGGTSTEDPTGATQSSWDLVIKAGDFANTRYGATTLATNDAEAALGFKYADTYMWRQKDIPVPGTGTGWADYWEKIQETVIQSSQALGTIDMTVSLGNANFGTALTGLSSGAGNFFIGEGEGAVRIDYNANTDTVTNLVDRVNSSDANVHMYYDPVSDRFVIRNKDAGAVGITLHESTTWDALTANAGAGNLLNSMGLAAPATINTTYNAGNHASYSNGDYVKLDPVGGDPDTYWQALTDTITEGPSVSSAQWRQVIRGVGRAMESELGQNSSVKVNGGELVYSTETTFTDAEHGYKGISFDIAQAAVGESASFVVAKDSSQAKAAIEKFVEEFNDAQDYIRSLTAVTNDGEKVTAGKFSSNIEISRLGSQLRKVVFGDSTPHSESGTTADGSDLIINTNDANNAELVAIAGNLNFDSNNDGYIVKVLDDAGTGTAKYWKYEMLGGLAKDDWTETEPAYSSFRLSNIGLDFGTGSDRMLIKNSALLIQELEENPDKVKALFTQATATAFDVNTQASRTYQGVSEAVDEFISAFLSGDSDSGYKGAYNTHIESVRSQNKRIDDKIEDLERYLEQRENTLSAGFMRMEEMQSQLNTQLQTLQNSFKK